MCSIFAHTSRQLASGQHLLALPWSHILSASLKCARRESSPGHKHGRLVCCRYTTGAHVLLFYLNTVRGFAAIPRKKRSREAVPITKVCGRPALMFAALLPSLQMLSGDSPRLSRGEQVPTRRQTQRARCQWDKTSNGSRALLGAEAETSCTLIQRCPTRSTSSTRTSRDSLEANPNALEPESLPMRCWKRACSAAS